MPSAWKESLDRWRRRWDGLSYGQQRMFRTLATLVLLAAVAPPAYFAARPLLNRWRHHHALAQAAQFEKQEDYRNLILALHRAVQIQPNDVATWRWVARTLDALGNRESLVAHENIVALAPNDSPARAALAAAALRFGSAETARATLRQLERDPAQRETYLRLAAELARADDDFPGYAKFLAALAAARPDDSEVRFNLAVLQLVARTPAEQQHGYDALVDLLGDSRVRVRAALQLLGHAARQRDAALAASVARSIAGAGNPPAAAKLSATDPWPILLGTLEHLAVEGGDADVARVAQWLGTVRRAREALTWLDRVPETMRDAPAVREIAAELGARIGDLARLRALLAVGAWGAVQPESIDAALAARNEQLAQHPGAALTRWQDALRFAQQSPATLRALGRLARLWQNEAGVETAAKAALQIRPDSPWANRELRDIYIARGDTPKLLSHCSAWVALDPRRPALVFDWVRAAAALDRVDDEMERRTAALVADPNRSAITDVARAFVLWRRRQPTEAIAILDRLPPLARTLPEYHLARALVANDQIAQQQLTQFSWEFLPEEKKLLKFPDAQVDKRR